MAAGFPLGMHGVKTSKGIVSGYQEVGQALYVGITAPINPGNSGGPLYNVKGEVIGINSAKFKGAARMAFAIPSNQVKVMLDALYLTRQWRVPVTGLSLSPGSSNLNAYLTGRNHSTGGVYVRSVKPNSVFSSAGVKKGDLLLALDGQKINNEGTIMVKALQDRVKISGLLARKKVQSLLTAHVYRKNTHGPGGKLLKLSTMYQQTPPLKVPMILEPLVDVPKFQIVAGIVFMELNLNLAKVFMASNPTDMMPYLKTDGVEKEAEPVIIISHIIPDSMAAKEGTAKPGTIVEQVNGMKIMNMRDLCNALHKNSKFWTMSTRRSLTVLSMKEVDLDLQQGKGSRGKYGRASTGCLLSAPVPMPKVRL
jgi:S1-C subfamily serine protease